MKKCFKCGEELPLAAFYKHKQMADGYLNKCKVCAKKDSTNNRNNNLEKIREYDRNRGNRQPAGYLKEHRQKYPNQTRAQRKIAYEVSVGTLTSEPCENCGADDKQHAHHDDYSKPLVIRWLCAACHKQWHEINGEGLNR